MEGLMVKFYDVISLSGKVNRTVWWASRFVLGFLSCLVDYWGSVTIDEYMIAAVAMAYFILLILYITFSIARFKDAGWSPWWVLCPIINPLVPAFAKGVQQ